MFPLETKVSLNAPKSKTKQITVNTEFTCQPYLICIILAEADSPEDDKTGGKKKLILLFDTKNDALYCQEMITLRPN